MNKIINDKFCVTVTTGRFGAEWPSYFTNFVSHCNKIADKNGWPVVSVINHQLKPWKGKLIQTSTQGMYLRWNKESSHTMFVLRWI